MEKEGIEEIRLMKWNSVLETKKMGNNLVNVHHGGAEVRMWFWEML